MSAASPAVLRTVHARPKPRVRQEVLRSTVCVSLRRGSRAAVVVQYDRRGDERDEPKDVVVEPDRVHEQEAEAHQSDHRDGAAAYEEDLPHRHRGLILWGYRE